jgi:hypothetical protein
MKKIGKNMQIVFYVVFAVLAVAAFALIFSLSNGFTQKVNTFMLVDGNNYILSNEYNMRWTEQKTFTVHHFKDDTKITAKIEPLLLANDFTFTMNGKEYRWNKDIVRADVDISRYIEAVVNNTANTVTVIGTVSAALEEFATASGATLDNVGIIPQEDMLRLIVASGGSTISVEFSVAATVQSIKLDKYEYKFD